jgi:hypothetical protein
MSDPKQPVGSTSQTVTIRVPKPLYREARNHCHNAHVSMNYFFVECVTIYLKELERAAIDAAFSGMATDVNYRQMSEELSR